MRSRAPASIPWKRLVGFAVALLTISLGTWFLVGRPSAPADAHRSLRVMTYSSFMNAWGPGPEIAKRFRKQSGVSVEFHDAGDAGLILEKLKLFPVDVVVGIDGLSLPEAGPRQKWKTPEFQQIDYSPMAFVYREGEIDPPKNLRDLLDPKYKGKIALEDPRTSTPGLQFLLWILDEFGEEEAFKYLEGLKENLHSISPNWSGAYGSFTKKQSSLVFSYLTSPVYHLLEEKDASYRAAVFEEGHSVQREYAGVPANCTRCSDGEEFLRFLGTPEIQALIMKKNFMLPALESAKAGTPFANLPAVQERELKTAPDFMKRRAELFERWRALGL